MNIQNYCFRYKATTINKYMYNQTYSFLSAPKLLLNCAFYVFFIHKSALFATHLTRLTQNYNNLHHIATTLRQSTSQHSYTCTDEAHWCWLPADTCCI